jgi:hypothetical protein
MNKVKLENISGGMFVGNLDHAVMCGVGPCSCSSSPGAKLNYKNGKVVGAHVQPKRHPQVITLLADEVSGELPIRVKHCPEISAALAATPPKLRLVAVDADRGLTKPGAPQRKNFRPSPEHVMKARHEARSEKAKAHKAEAKHNKTTPSSEG